MPRLTHEQHSTQTSAAIHAEAELNQTTDNSSGYHYIDSIGDSPNKRYIVYFYYPDGQVKSFDGREWKDHSLRNNTYVNPYHISRL